MSGPALDESADRLPCPACGGQRTRALKTYYHEAREGVYRRRQCQDCQARFASLETVISERGVWSVLVQPGRLGGRDRA